jgi:hypothetical protein
VGSRAAIAGENFCRIGDDIGKLRGGLKMVEFIRLGP